MFNVEILIIYIVEYYLASQLQLTHWQIPPTDAPFSTVFNGIQIWNTKLFMKATDIKYTSTFEGLRPITE